MNTTAKGDVFEVRVHALLEKLLRDGSLLVNSKYSKIYHKRAYYSKDRGANIVFDIAIETYLPGAKEFSLLTLFECKNYTSSVPVNDVEEFSAKIDQVGQHNTKGIFISNNSFQTGALNFARSRKITLARVKDQGPLEWTLYRKDKIATVELLCADELGAECYFVAEFENNLLMSLQSLLLNLGIIDHWKPTDDLVSVPYLTGAGIDGLIRQMNIDRCYWGRHLDISLLCETLSSLYDVAFDLEAELPMSNGTATLGSIRFDPLIISINKDITDKNRRRFTLAHEIGHLVLHRDLLRPFFNVRSEDETTIEVGAQFSSAITSRLEFQANMFASQLLLPKEPLARYMAAYFKRNNIHTGFIFLDGQPINQMAVSSLLTDISREFGVSKEVAKLRLKRCNLLKGESDRSIFDVLRESRFV